MSNQQNQRRTAWTKPWMLLTLPTGLAVVFGAYAAIAQWSAYRQVNRRIAELKTQNAPIDNASLQSRFISNTDAELSVPWNDLESTLSNYWVATLATELPHLGSGQTHTPAIALRLGEGWQQEQEVAELLDYLAPALDQLHQLSSQTTKPIWWPVHFAGLQTFNTRLPSFQCLRVLLLEYDYSIYVRDRQRAIKCLRTINAISNAIGNDGLSYWIGTATSQMVNDAVSTSLQTPIWTTEDLELLLKLVPSIDHNRNLTRTLDTYVAIYLSELQSPSNTDPMFNSPESAFGFAHRLPSIQNQTLEDFELLRSTNKLQFPLDPNEIVRRIRSTKTKTIFGLQFSTAQYLTQGYEIEISRRLTRTAVLVKYYRLLRSSHPESIQEVFSDPQISQLTAGDNQDWQPDFGYKSADGFSYLWNLHTGQNPHSPVTELPEFDFSTGQARGMLGRAVRIY